MDMARKSKEAVGSKKYVGTEWVLRVYETRATLNQGSGGNLPALEAWRYALSTDAETYWRAVASLADAYDKQGWEWHYYWDRWVTANGPCTSPFLSRAYVFDISRPEAQAFIQGAAEAADRGAGWDSLLNIAEWLRKEGAEVKVEVEVADDARVQGVANWRRSSPVLEALSKRAFERAIQAQEEVQRAKEEGR